MRLALCIGIVLAGCGEQAEPRCGDGVCDNDEERATCKVDCPLVFCEDCDHTQTCLARTCVHMFRPGRYELVLSHALLVSPRPDGSAWDVDGPADPYLVVTRAATPTRPGAVLATSSVAPDTTEPSWDESGGIYDAADSDQFILEVFDDDGAVDELMWSCEHDASMPTGGLAPGLDTLTYLCLTPAGDRVELWLALQ